MEMLRIAVVGIICLIVCVIVRQLKPELLPFVQLASIMAVVVLCADYLDGLLDSVSALVGEIKIIEDGYIMILLKTSGVAVLSKIAAEICRDNGNSALGANVELVGKIVILSICMPLLQTLVELARGFLN